MGEAPEMSESSTSAEIEKALGEPSAPPAPRTDGPPEVEYPGFKALALIMLAIYLSVFLVALVSLHNPFPQ